MKDPNRPFQPPPASPFDAKPQRNRSSEVSRRAFLKGGAATAIASGGLASTAEAREVGEGAEAGANSAAGRALLGPGVVPLELHVNGKRHAVELEPRVTLLDALRDALGITGPKKVCDRATCGSCTVLVDGELIYSCSRLAIECQGLSVTTVEGLGTPENLHPVQRAFVEHDAQQCGFCTPGFILAVAKLLSDNPNPNEQEVTDALGGNLCRCGTYGGIRKVLIATSVGGLEGGRL